MSEDMSCQSRRSRAITDQSGNYVVELECSEFEAHQQHYDDSFLQAWRDDEPEPLEKSNTSSPSMWGMYGAA
jgi:hypothetical protein